MRRRRIKYSNDASADLTTIHGAVAMFDRRAADRLRGEIILKVGLLAEFPAIGHARSDSPDADYRFSNVRRKYLIIYAFDDARLNVVRIIDGSRDLRRLL